MTASTSASNNDGPADNDGVREEEVAAGAEQLRHPTSPPHRGLDLGADVPASWWTVLTTEHYNLQTQRAATISETNGRASIFLGAVSAGLIALGFSLRPGPPTAGVVAFGVAVLGALTLLGLLTFIRTVQTSIDDAAYAGRIEVLRNAYAELLPALAPVLSSARGQDSYLEAVRRGWWQRLVTVSASLAMITSLLAGAALGLLIYGSTSQLLVGLIAAALLTGAAVVVLMGVQRRLWMRSGALQARGPQA